MILPFPEFNLVTSFTFLGGILRFLVKRGNIFRSCDPGHSLIFQHHKGTKCLFGRSIQLAECPSVSNVHFAKFPVVRNIKFRVLNWPKCLYGRAVYLDEVSQTADRRKSRQTDERPFQVSWMWIFSRSGSVFFWTAQVFVFFPCDRFKNFSLQKLRSSKSCMSDPELYFFCLCEQIFYKM